jgi:hypothetical protein
MNVKLLVLAIQVFAAVLMVAAVPIFVRQSARNVWAMGQVVEYVLTMKSVLIAPKYVRDVSMGCVQIFQLTRQIFMGTIFVLVIQGVMVLATA